MMFFLCIGPTVFISLQAVFVQHLSSFVTMTVHLWMSLKRLLLIIDMLLFTLLCQLIYFHYFRLVISKLDSFLKLLHPFFIYQGVTIICDWMLLNICNSSYLSLFESRRGEQEGRLLKVYEGNSQRGFFLC